MKNNKYDIFISYRRDTGRPYARIMQMALEKRGYRVFLDYDELKDGVFGDNIRQAIISAPIFMPILSPHYLDRCVNEGDWVRKEIEIAIKEKKHFVPINPDNSFDGIPKDIPQDIKEVISSNQHSEILFGQPLEATMKMMVDNRIRPYFKWHFRLGNIRIIELIAIIVLLIAAVVGGFIYSRNDSQRKELASELALCKTMTDYENFIQNNPKSQLAQQAQDSLNLFIKLQDQGRAVLNNKASGTVSERERHANTIDNLVWSPKITLNQLRACRDILNHMMEISAAGVTFTIGDNNGLPYDHPEHKVSLSDDYYMCQYEITRGWWNSVMNDSLTTENSNHPVSDITWSEAQEFCKALNKLTGLNFSLPTEAQWEWAATSDEPFTYSGSNDPREVAWFASNSNDKTSEVGMLEPNNNQLYDMSGNVAEYCLDRMTRYDEQAQTDPYFESDGETGKVVIRGGSYQSSADYLGVRHRDPQNPTLRNPNVGFRVVLKK